jgi:hypothetical protein
LRVFALALVRAMPTQQFGVTGGGLRAAVLRDLDCLAVRQKMPPRALPDDVRRKLGLGDRKGSPFGEAEAAGQLAAAPAQSAKSFRFTNAAPSKAALKQARTKRSNNAEEDPAKRESRLAITSSSASSRPASLPAARK